MNHSSLSVAFLSVRNRYQKSVAAFVALVGLTCTFPTIASVVTATGPGGNILDNDITNSVANISEDLVVTDVTITIKGLTHSYLSDLTATLTAPDGTTMSDIFREVCFGNNTCTSINYNGDYTFEDGGVSLWDAAEAAAPGDVPGGTYAASSRDINGEATVSLADVFGGVLSGGDWTLSIEDNVFGDTGTFTGWEINATVVPVPAAVWLFGSGLIGLIGIAKRKQANRV